MCGVIGIWANDEVFHDLYQGLLSIQHRGQDAAGIITYDGKFHEKKGGGLVMDIFGQEEAAQLKGHIGIGHTRYPTVGGGGQEDAQPFMLNSPFGIVLAHNGNVVNYRQLKKNCSKSISACLILNAMLRLFLIFLPRNWKSSASKSLRLKTFLKR